MYLFSPFHFFCHENIPIFCNITNSAHFYVACFRGSSAALTTAPPLTVGFSVDGVPALTMTIEDKAPGVFSCQWVYLWLQRGGGNFERQKFHIKNSIKESSEIFPLLKDFYEFFSCHELCPNELIIVV